MPLAAKGLAKLDEELHELGQVVGKKLAYYHVDEHPDGGPPLSERMEDEMGDVFAAVQFVIQKWGLNATRIAMRSGEKLALFQKWDADPNNNRDAVDGVR